MTVNVSFLEYKAEYENRYKFRFYNWEDFVEEKTIFENKNAKYLLIILHYNNKNIYQLLYKIIEDTYFNKEFQVLIIDNNSKVGLYTKLKHFCKNYKINLIRTKVNIGGAGGYSIGVEYFLSKTKFSHLIIMEDDVILLQKDSVKEIIDSSKENPDKIIHSNYIEYDVPSYTLHFTLYPRHVIENVGCLNVFYFMRSDDYEYAYRINKICEKYNISKIYLKTLNYSHPVLKGYKYNTFFDYLAKRNTLLFLNRYFDKKYFKNYLIVLMISTFNAIFYSLKHKNSTLLAPILLALKDTLFNQLSLKRNLQLLNNSKTLEIKNYKVIKISNLKKTNYKTLSPIINKFLKIPYGFSLECFITSNKYYPFYFLSSLSKRPIYILDIEVLKGKVKLYQENNSKKDVLINFIFFIFSIFLFVILIMPILTLIIFKVFIGFLKRRGE